MIGAIINPLRPPTQQGGLPILADHKSMEEGKKGEAQAKKVNEIISSMYDDFTVRTTQRQITTNASYRASSYRSQIVDNVKDACYNQFGNLSFDFYAIGIKKDTVTPILELNVRRMLGNIQFTGVDDKSSPLYNLANYGYFIFTKNEGMDEYQLSFYAESNVPERIWYCSVSFIVAQVGEDTPFIEETLEVENGDK